MTGPSLSDELRERIAKTIAFELRRPEMTHEPFSLDTIANAVIEASGIERLLEREERMREALEQIRDVNGSNYESDRAWALGLQLRAKTALDGWLLDGRTTLSGEGA